MTRTLHLIIFVSACVSDRPIWEVPSTQITAQYKKLAKIVHPDKNKNHGRNQNIVAIEEDGDTDNSFLDIEDQAARAFQALHSAYRALRDDKERVHDICIGYAINVFYHMKTYLFDMR